MKISKLAIAPSEDAAHASRYVYEFLVDGEPLSRAFGKSLNGRFSVLSFSRAAHEQAVSSLLYGLPRGFPGARPALYVRRDDNGKISDAITALLSPTDKYFRLSDFADDAGLRDAPGTLFFEVEQFETALEDHRLQLATIFGEDSLQERVRDILYFVWDPIGFSPLLPRNEYDNFIPRIARLVSAGVETDVFHEWLKSIETGQIGVGAKTENRMKAAILLARLSQELRAAT